MSESRYVWLYVVLRRAKSGVSGAESEVLQLSGLGQASILWIANACAIRVKHDSICIK